MNRVLFAGWEEHLEQAKEYCRKNNLTPEQVKIVKTLDGMILVKERAGFRNGEE